MPDLFMKLVGAKKVIVYPIYENWSDLGFKRKVDSLYNLALFKRGKIFAKISILN